MKGILDWFFVSMLTTRLFLFPWRKQAPLSSKKQLYQEKKRDKILIWLYKKKQSPAVKKTLTLQIYAPLMSFGGAGIRKGVSPNVKAVKPRALDADSVAQLRKSSTT